MPRIKREARKGKMITLASWDSEEIKLLLEATEDIEKVIPDIEEEYKDPKDFKKALKRFLELSNDMRYDDVSLTIVPKNTNEYPRFRISFSDTGEIRVRFFNAEDKPEYQNITKAIDLLEEAKKTLLNVRRE
ncbi:protein of unknown function (plasmid) [Thermococcus nautili]|uniref:hypothetical protein n=1 Tax=Thermococcus nautili TaxID=195522 RepID=UPI0025534529|nr:hypothetical protein [Thermococcus nautili]CAI1494125.1 protein of unknown function [Thermococcus nautili]